MRAVLGRVTIAVMLVLPILLADVPTTAAVPIPNGHFARTWERTDKPIADLVVSRTWMWGNEPFTAAGPEKYAEAPSGLREVQYFDKSRMEINHDPNVPTNSPWYVTNGLLVRELMTGEVQVGDAAFEPREPAHVNVAGDPDDASGVTYWFMGLLQDEAPLSEGTVINQILAPGAAGNLYLSSSEMAAYGISAARFVPETNHTVAAPFWDFMNASGTIYENGTYHEAALFENAFYATGLPLTEAYWANVKLAGTYQPVLIQCFERRCLTYTPNNDPAWRVEAGNVGQHYFRWRYDALPNEPTPEPATDYQWSATWSDIPKPLGIDTDEAGNVYVTSYSQSVGHSLHKYSGAGTHQWSLTYDTSISYAEYYDDISITSDEQGGWIYVLAGQSKTVHIITTDGVYITNTTWAGCRFSDPSPCNELSLFYPKSIEMDDQDTVIIVDGHLMLQLNPVLEYKQLYEIQGFQAHDLEIDKTTGDRYFADRGSVPKAVVKFSRDDVYLDSWDLSWVPDHLTVDNRGYIYVTDVTNHKITIMTVSGDIVSEIGDFGSGNGQFNFPRGIAVDRHGDVYVADYLNNRVQKFSASP